MADINLQVNSDLQAQVGALESRLQGKVIRKALTKLVLPLKAQMKSRITRRTGATRRSVGHRTVTGSKGRRIYVGLRYRKTNRKGYVAGLMLERGTKHMRARPFVGPVAELNAEKVQRELRGFIEQQLDEAFDL